MKVPIIHVILVAMIEHGGNRLRRTRDKLLVKLCGLGFLRFFGCRGFRPAYDRRAPLMEFDLTK